LTKIVNFSINLKDRCAFLTLCSIVTFWIIFIYCFDYL